MFKDARSSAAPSQNNLAAHGLHIYLLIIVILPLLLLLSAFLIVPTRWYDLHSGNTYLPNIGYGAGLSNRDCQVLIYGDSSAMVGLSPTLIQQQTGLTTCNIAEFEEITLISHTLLIDMFLQHNPRPRFIVFLYAPEDLSVTNDWNSFHVGTFEGVTFMLEHARNFKAAWLLATHPDTTLAWAEGGLRLALEHLHSRPTSYAVAHLRETTNGRLPVDTEHSAQCDGIAHDRLPDPAWINQLRQRYGTDGTRVIVDATPTVSCDPSLLFFQQHVNGLVDNSPYEPIPISSYSSDGRLHANRQGSELLSAMVGKQIVNLLNPPTTAGVTRNTGER